MKHFAVVVILGACGSSTPPAESPSNETKAAELRCKTAVEHAGEAAKLAAKDVTMAIGECEQKEWSRQARECIDAVKSETDLVACADKNAELGKKGIFAERLTMEKAMKAMGEFKDKMCACKDTKCVQAVSDEMTKWSQDMTKDNQEPPKFTDEDTKRATAIGEQMGKCMQAAMGTGGTP